MYRIELSPGEETAFRSIEELAVAIKRKVVTSHARIYHNATGRWLPIQFHPHYKQALSMPLTQADLVAGPPVTPLSTLKLGEPTSPPAAQTPSNREAATQAALAAWPEPKPAAPKPEPQRAAPPAPAPRQIAPTQPPITLGTPAPEPRSSPEPRRSAEYRLPPEPVRRVEPVRAAPPRYEPPRMAAPDPAPQHRRTKRSGKRKSMRSLRVALAGAVLIAGAHLVVTSAPEPATEVGARLRSPRQLIQAPTETLRETSRTVAAVMPGLQSIPVPGLTQPSAQARSAPRPRPTPPAPVATSDSAVVSAPAPEIGTAPAAAEITTSVPLHAESLTAEAVDSSGKKALKRILHTIDGTAPAPGSKTPKP